MATSETGKQRIRRPQPPSHPSLFHSMTSHTFLSQAPGRATTQQAKEEGSSLLAQASAHIQYSTMSNFANTPLVSEGVSSNITYQQPLRRPELPRAAATSLAIPTTSAASAAAAPISSRPILTRAAATTAIGGPMAQRDNTVTRPAGRPGLLRRITESVTTTLDLSADNSSTHNNRPPAPSHWIDHAHLSTLVRTWDDVSETVSSSKYPRSTTAQVVSTEKAMLEQFPELGEGEVPLGRAWIEYVLGVSLRPPFNSAEKMGRWEMLASTGGARACWGPW